MFEGNSILKAQSMELCKICLTMWLPTGSANIILQQMEVDHVLRLKFVLMHLTSSITKVSQSITVN